LTYSRKEDGQQLTVTSTSEDRQRRPQQSLTTGCYSDRCK